MTDLVFVKRLPLMEKHSVIPHDYLADGPVVMKAETRIGGVSPKLVQEFFALIQRKTNHIGIRAPTEKQRFVFGGRNPPQNRVAMADCLYW